jgi:hypothetical protein
MKIVSKGNNPQGCANAFLLLRSQEAFQCKEGKADLE